MDIPDQVPNPDLEHLLAAMERAQDLPYDLGALAGEHHRDLIDTISMHEPLDTAAAVGGLMTMPLLQSQSHRLRVLAHFVVQYATGDRPPTRELLADAFHALGAGPCGPHEDSADDVFISLVTCPEGNFRTFEDSVEGSAFMLQRFINLAEAMPPDEPTCIAIRRRIYALLRLSDAVAARGGLARYAIGSTDRHDTLPEGVPSAETLARIVTFSHDDLAEMGIEIEELAPFLFDSKRRGELGSETLGHTLLERAPLLFDGVDIILALPSAVSVAIRRYMIEIVTDLGLASRFERGLAEEHCTSLSLAGVGRWPALPREFTIQGGAAFATQANQIDPGRWVHVVMIIDGLSGYEMGGMVGENSAPEALGAAVRKAAEEAFALASSEPDFIEGFTLVVCGGWGRGVGLTGMPIGVPGWRFASIAAHDYDTLVGIKNMTPLDLWQILEMEETIEEHGVELMNVAGLLNLVAWTRKNGGHLVPHSRLPDAFASNDVRRTLHFGWDDLQGLRQEVLTSRDFMHLADGSGKRFAVRRNASSPFREDLERPIYADLAAARAHRYRIVYWSSARTWWLEVGAEGRDSFLSVLKLADMLEYWLGASVPVLERHLPKLPQRPIHWIVTFERVARKMALPQMRAEEILRQPVFTTCVEPEDAIIRLHIAEAFMGAFHHPENVAERALVAELVRATIRLTGTPPSERTIDEIVAEIVTSPDARCAHMPIDRRFREYVAHTLPKLVDIGELEVAAVKLGLGWRAQPRSAPSQIEGKAECTAFLNQTVQELETELCEVLKHFNRRAMIEAVILNMEAAEKGIQSWTNTAPAVLGLRKDREDVLRVITEEIARGNAVTMSSRTIIEAAICECPTSGGRTTIGTRDLKALMVIAASIFHLAGWSDAIHQDAMEPRLKISPLGDIQTSARFHDQVLEPFGRLGTARRVDEAVGDYADRYDLPENEAVDLVQALGEAFLNAWHIELGFPVEHARDFPPVFEALALERESAIQLMRRSEAITALMDEKSDSGAAVAFIDALTMVPRPNWRTPDKGHRQRDRDPWRFRRRLSLMRRPIIQVDEDGDPMLLIAPGMLSDHLAYLLHGFHSGSFDKSYCTTPEMKAWIGAANDARGHAFNALVCHRMGELGWNARSDQKVGAILKRRFDKNYGDVDVLAWNPDGRVLLIECKDLQFQKTPGEVAAQLADFRGELNVRGDPDDLLKHIRRYRVIRDHLDALQRFTGLQEIMSVECWVVFRNPVPMQFVWERVGEVAKMRLFDDLEGI